MKRVREVNCTCGQIVEIINSSPTKWKGKCEKCGLSWSLQYYHKLKKEEIKDA